MAKPEYLDTAFEEICKEITQIFIKKNKDYGKGNILDTGELGIAFRVNDKLNRLKNLLQSGKDPVNECLDDSWKDIAVYAIIALLYRKDEFQKLELSPKVKWQAKRRK